MENFAILRHDANPSQPRDRLFRDARQDKDDLIPVRTSFGRESEPATQARVGVMHPDSLLAPRFESKFRTLTSRNRQNYQGSERPSGFIRRLIGKIELMDNPPFLPEALAEFSRESLRLGFAPPDVQPAVTRPRLRSAGDIRNIDPNLL
jgi:hypothetical protein